MFVTLSLRLKQTRFLSLLIKQGKVLKQTEWNNEIHNVLGIQKHMSVT